MVGRKYEECARIGKKNPPKKCNNYGWKSLFLTDDCPSSSTRNGKMCKAFTYKVTCKLYFSYNWWKPFLFFRMWRIPPTAAPTPNIRCLWSGTPALGAPPKKTSPFLPAPPAHQTATGTIAIVVVSHENWVSKNGKVEIWLQISELGDSGEEQGAAPALPTYGKIVVNFYENAIKLIFKLPRRKMVQTVYHIEIT